MQLIISAALLFLMQITSASANRWTGDESLIYCADSKKCMSKVKKFDSMEEIMDYFKGYLARWNRELPRSIFVKISKLPEIESGTTYPYQCENLEDEKIPFHLTIVKKNVYGNHSDDGRELTGAESMLVGNGSSKVYRRLKNKYSMTLRYRDGEITYDENFPPIASAKGVKVDFTIAKRQNTASPRSNLKRADARKSLDLKRKKSLHHMRAQELHLQ